MTHGVVSMLKVREFASTLVNCVVPTGYGNYYAIKRANDLKFFDLEDLKHMMKINRVYIFGSHSVKDRKYTPSQKTAKNCSLIYFFLTWYPFPGWGVILSKLIIEKFF